MIITKKVKISISNKNILRFREFGYLDIKIGDKIDVNVNELYPMSDVKIDVKCDICNKEKNIAYNGYTRGIKNCGFYACSKKCSIEKIKNTNREKYGVDFYSQTYDYIGKIKQTCNEKYGVDFYTQTDSYKEKSKNTCLKKYGTESYTKTNEYKEKVKNTCLAKYGEDNYMKTEQGKESNKNICIKKYGTNNHFQSSVIKEKSKKTCLEKYGVEHISQSNEIKAKVKKTNLEKYGSECYNTSDVSKEKNKVLYGVEYYSQTDDFKNKWKYTMKEKYGKEFYSQTEDFKKQVKLTCLKNYGVDSPMKNRDIVEKSLKSRGLDFESDEYLIYRRKVNNLTKKNKKELFENWNGYDFYDNEYIKDNLVLSWNSGKYPTIDHKISAYDGFKNGIPPEEISKMENLCITKKSINSSKNRKSIT